MGKRKQCVKLDPDKVVAYLRVSTEDQDDTSQEHVIKEWANRTGTILVHMAREKIGGDKPLDLCPELASIVQTAIGLGSGRVIAKSLDRVSRDPLKLLLVERACREVGIVLETCTEGVIDTSSFVGLLTSMVGAGGGREEKRKINARTREGMANNRARGWSTGTPPYGTTRASIEMIGSRPRTTLQIAQNEAQVIEIVHKWRTEGITVGAITTALEARGVRSRSGAPLTRTAVARICSRMP